MTKTRWIKKNNHHSLYVWEEGKYKERWKVVELAWSKSFFQMFIFHKGSYLHYESLLLTEAQSKKYSIEKAKSFGLLKTTKL